MIYRLGADAVLLLHLGFVLFALLGGLLVAGWRWVLPIHLLAVGWALYVQLASAFCPLTGWEQALRIRAGDAGYSGSFVEHYLLPIIYPHWLTLPLQYVLAAVVVVVNLAIYGWLWRRRANRRARLRS